MRKLTMPSFLLLGLSLSAVAAPITSETLDFTYSGSRPSADLGVAYGGGSLSFIVPAGTNTIGLSDLTAFSLTDTITITYDGLGTSTQSYSLADVSSILVDVLQQWSTTMAFLDGSGFCGRRLALQLLN